VGLPQPLNKHPSHQLFSLGVTPESRFEKKASSVAFLFSFGLVGEGGAGEGGGDGVSCVLCVVCCCVVYCVLCVVVLCLVGFRRFRRFLRFREKARGILIWGGKRGGMDMDMERGKKGEVK